MMRAMRRVARWLLNAMKLLALLWVIIGAVVVGMRPQGRISPWIVVGVFAASCWLVWAMFLVHVWYAIRLKWVVFADSTRGGAN